MSNSAGNFAGQVTHSSVGRLVLAGLVGGLVLNAIDTPWSVIVMVPKLAAFQQAHGLNASPLVGPWFLVTHFLFIGAIAWTYAHLRQSRGPGWTQRLLSIGTFVVVNRLFGFANVLMGLMPADVFLGFSASFVVGTLIAGLVATAVIDRGR